MTDTKKSLVLIVDDRLESIESLRKCIAISGYDVVTVRTPAKALAYLKSSRPDIILIDLVLDKRSGLDLCGRIRSSPGMADLPVLMFSGLDESEQRISALHLGARDFISKGCEDREIVARLALHLKLAENERLLRVKNHELSAAYEQLQATQEQVVQAEKLAMLGRLAAGVAHEISTPLSFITSNLRSLSAGIRDLYRIIDAEEDFIALCKAGARQERLDAQAEAIRLLREELQFDTSRTELDSMCRDSLEGMELLVRVASDLREFSRDDKHDLVSADINSLIDKALNMVRMEIGARISVQRKSGKLPAVMCIPSRITQVFLILVVNALQSMSGRGILRLVTSSRKGWVKVAVEDTGKGILPEHLGRVFDPFFTTKSGEKGMGLGLTIAQKILTFHGGRISVTSECGKGTRVIVEIPVMATGVKVDHSGDGTDT